MFEQSQASILKRWFGHVEMCCYFHMRANDNPPVQPVPKFFDYEIWTSPAPLRAYDAMRRLWCEGRSSRPLRPNRRNLTGCLPEKLVLVVTSHS